MSLTNDREKYIGACVRRARHRWAPIDRDGKIRGSREDLAKRVKELVPNSLVTADVLENIETGRTRLKLSDALDIAIALGVPLVNLFVDVQKPFENNPLFPDGKTNLQIYDEQRLDDFELQAEDTDFKKAGRLLADTNKLQWMLKAYPVHGLVDISAVAEHKYRMALREWNNSQFWIYTDKGRFRMGGYSKTPQPKRGEYSATKQEQVELSLKVFKMLVNTVNDIAKNLNWLGRYAYCIPDEMADRILDAVAEAGRCVQSFDVDAISVSQPKYWDVSFEELVARVRKSNVESLD